MEEILARYFELIQLEKKLEKKYIPMLMHDNKNIKSIRKITNDTFIWRRVHTIEDIGNIIKKGKINELLKIEDVYTDIVCDIYELEYGKKLIDSVKDTSEEGEAFENKNYLRILNDKKSSPILKDNIEILLKASIVCKELLMQYRLLNERL